MALILKEGKHFTPVGLRDWINKNLGHRLEKTGKLNVTTNDIHQYILKGKLPAYLGGNEIKQKYNPSIGFKYIELSSN